MVTSKDIRNGTITSADIKDGSVGTGELTSRAKEVASSLHGYEQVDHAYEDVPLPISSLSFFNADCSAGKLPLRAGSLVQLYNSSGFVKVGRGPISVQMLSTAVDVTREQPAESGATKARVTITAVCAKGAAAQ